MAEPVPVPVARRGDGLDQIERLTRDISAVTECDFRADQEPLLKRYSYAVYAGAVDENGYFPTRNLRSGFLGIPTVQYGAK
jgi:hypothetical protein